MRSDILIIGGGVVGMSCAHELSRRGAQVTVIDKGEPGFGCSYGNAGWITPCFAMPLPMPGMLLKSIGWLLDPESPLYIKPAADPLLMRWLTRFLFSMTEKKMLRSVRALTEISKYSLNAYAELDREYNGAFGFERKGLLMACQSQGGLDYAVQEMNLVAKHGVPGKTLTPDELRALEPAVTGPIVGGVYFPEEAHAEPLAVVRTLAEGAKRHGAKVISGAEVFEFKTEGGQVREARTTRGDFSADQFVMATGSWSHEIANQLSLDVPVLGGKGYALIVPPFDPAPKIPLMLVEKKIAVTPRQGTIRLAGTLELVNQDYSITPRRVDAIVRGARQFLNVPEKPEVQEIWRGLRPCTPDGVPIIGRSSKFENLLLLTGHQMLGLQSAPGSARLAADLLLKQAPAFDPAPFRADRF